MAIAQNQQLSQKWQQNMTFVHWKMVARQYFETAILEMAAMFYTYGYDH